MNFKIMIKNILSICFCCLVVSSCGNTQQVTSTPSDSVPVGQAIPNSGDISVPVGSAIPQTGESVPVGGAIPNSESVPVGGAIPDAEKSVPVGGAIPSSADPVRAQWEMEDQQIRNHIAALGGDWEFTGSGIYYMVDEKGSSGKFPTGNSIVKVNYKGTLLNGTVFDEAYGVQFGLDAVIAGWTEGMQLLKEGDSITMFLPSYLGYGTAGAGRMIPPNSILRFDVDLLGAN